MKWSLFESYEFCFEVVIIQQTRAGLMVTCVTYLYNMCHHINKRSTLISINIDPSLLLV